MAIPNATMPTPTPMLPCTARLNSSGPLGLGGLPGGRGQRRLGLVACGFVVDRGLDHRLGEDPREDEREQSGQRSDRGAAQHQRSDHQWQGKLSRWRASCTNSCTYMLSPKTDVAPWSIPTK